MQLNHVKIKNFRSIEIVEISTKKLPDNSFTYGLLGINEAGKSSILRALALKDNIAAIKPEIADFRNKEYPIEVLYEYSLNRDEIRECFNAIQANTSHQINVSEKELQYINYIITVEKENLQKINARIDLKNSNSLEQSEILIISKDILGSIKEKLFKTIFWKAEDKYLISKPVPIQSFASKPREISIPLENCFKLAGVKDISRRLSLISDSTEREHLQEILGDKVTAHINKIWIKHPIKITFNISDTLINFHVKDSKAKGKAKTANQRSDGFRQFVSFLLTISAQNLNNELSNTLLLLDEPETHLHPKAQEDLLKELIKITNTNKNNIVFFATHANYMVDKDLLGRNLKVEKPKDETIITYLEDKTSTYASVNYDVFDIVTSDYHNELFAKAFYLSEKENLTDFDKEIQTFKNEKNTTKEYKQSGKKKFICSLSTYIRHQIHHPENSHNAKFTLKELDDSINILREIIRNSQRG